MQTTVMFVADSAPLGGVPVRLEGGDENGVLITDDEGRIELDLELGKHTFEIQYEGDWVERTVSRQGHSPLFVVNVRANDAQQIQTLNTLQIDLANLVGDRYVFETVLGRGGMGVVVKAIDRMLNRPVAIKLLSDELRENEEAQQIFLVEARNLATLSHPNLVAIHDILNVGGRVLMVFEYVLGENVEKTIKRSGRMEQLAVLRIGIQLARCVAYLHEHDLIHRDLKPANIIMQSDGQLKLVDFGLARSLNELYIRGTRVRGTPAYMAPEQIQGVHLTTATDLYQIGITLYEMLTGKLPFASGDMAYAHVHLAPPPILDRGPEVDRELAALIEQCLSKKPKERPQSAMELLERLQHVYARLATNEGGGALLDASTSGAFAPLSGEFSVVTSDHSEVFADEPIEMSFAEEVTGGSNRGLMIMALLGLVALVAAGAVFLSGGDNLEPSAAADSAAAIAVRAPEPTDDTAESEPAAQEETMDEVGAAVIASQGLAGFAITNAADQVTTLAAAAGDAPDEDRATRPDARVRSQPAAERPSNAVSDTSVRAEVTPDPPAPGGLAKPPKEPRKEKPAPKPSLMNGSKDSERSGTGLLSVDRENTKTLLPVTD